VEELRGAGGRARSGYERRRERNRSDQRRGVSLCKVMETRLLDYTAELPSLFLDAEAHSNGTCGLRARIYAARNEFDRVTASQWSVFLSALRAVEYFCLSGASLC